MLAKLSGLKSPALLLVRIVVGAIMIAHGFPKLVDSATWLERIQQMGFPAWAAYVAGGVEFFGGVLLILGLFTRFAAFLISGEMFIAFLRVHWKAVERGVLGFLGNSRDEFALVLSVVAFLLLTTGAGAFSLDRLLFKDKA